MLPSSLGAAVAAIGLPTGSPTTLPPVGPAPGAGMFDTGLVLGLGLTGLGLAALVGIVSYLGMGGLRQVDRQNVLEHPLRQALLQSVQAEPGAHLRDLATRHGTAVTNTQWHLRKLEMANLVKTQKVQGKRVYYPVQGGVASRDRALQNAALRNPNAEAVLAYIAGNPGTQAAAIGQGLGINQGTVRWHLRRLEDANLVRVIVEEQSTHYYAWSQWGPGLRSSPGPRAPPVRPALSHGEADDGVPASA